MRTPAGSEPSRLPWLVPALAVVAGAVLLVSAHLELRQVRLDARRSFETQVEAVTRLVGDGARQSMLALDLTYSLAEEELAHAALHVSGEVPAEAGKQAPAWLRVALVGGGPDGVSGRWGPLPRKSRALFIEEILAVPEGELVEGPIARLHGLYCLHHRVQGLERVLCGNAAELSARRRAAGLGRLLRDLAREDLVYVALQDRGGILARTPGPELPAAGDDLFPGAARPRFRDAEVGGRPLLEGTTAMVLPDSSSAVLRVGVDASGLRRMERRIVSRERAHLLLVTLLVISSVIMAWVLQSRQRHALTSERLRRQREEAQRQWQAIGQMAATVAHEVRAPLSTISMATQRLRREFAVSDADREEFAELLGLVASETGRLDRVIKDFLDLGRPLEVRPQRVRVDEVTRLAVAPLALRASESGKRLEMEACADEVELDPQRFAQLVSNLVGNALDAVDAPGGKVTVLAHVEAGWLEVVVTDNGPGLDAETLERVQLPFVSTKAHGTGLGLPLARRLAEAHGGTLILSSVVGAGTTARVKLAPKRNGA